MFPVAQSRDMDTREEGEMGGGRLGSLTAAHARQPSGGRTGGAHLVVWPDVCGRAHGQ